VHSQGPIGPVGIGGGWDLALLGLDRVLHDQDFVATTWRATPEARECSIHSYRAWGAASETAWQLRDDEISAVVEFAIQHFAPGPQEGEDT
jgi:hypothetical protein